jgi:hypothetical protein
MFHENQQVAFHFNVETSAAIQYGSPLLFMPQAAKSAAGGLRQCWRRRANYGDMLDEEKSP